MGATGVENKKIQVALLDLVTMKQIWPRVLPFLEKGKHLWEPYTDLREIKRSLDYGVYKLWVSMDEDIKAVMLTEFVTYPKTKVLRILYICGSDVIAIRDNLLDILAWGKRQGAGLCEIHGSPAWAKLLMPLIKGRCTTVIHIDVEESV